MEIIHIVLGKANPNRMNGVNKVVHELASKQTEAGVKVTVWGITPNTDHNYEYRVFNTVLYQAQKNPFTIDKALSEDIKRYADKAIFHIHGGWVPTFWAVAKSIKKNNGRYVFTGHGAYNTIAMGKNKWIKSVYFTIFEKYILRNAQIIHAIGQSEIAGLNQKYKAKNQVLCPYGYDVSEIEISADKLSNEKFVIGFVGRLDIHTKGLDLIVSAFHTLSKTNPQAELWIIVDSYQKENLIQMIHSKGENDKIRLMGSKFGEEKFELMSKMDVFIHASRNEGLPASILEAASMGLPIIATQATNLTDSIIKHNAGFAVADNNVHQIVEAMQQLLEQKQKNTLHRLGENAKEMVQSQFSWANVLPAFDHMYALAQKP